MIKVFIDASGWTTVVNANETQHNIAKEYFNSLLESRAKIYTSVIELDSAITKIKNECGLIIAQEFNKLIDEASLSAHLHISWLARRNRRNSLKQFFSIKESDVEMRHCIIFEEVRKKRINIIFSFDSRLKRFGIPLMPQG